MKRIHALAALTALFALCSCSTAQPVKSQAYANLPNQRTFEYELPVVLKAMEATFRNHKVVDRDPEAPSEEELRKLAKASLATDWIYSQSRDKYTEYKVNGVPRRKNLQMRIRYMVEAEKVMGGTSVTVQADEEVEKLKADGTPAGYSRVDKVDSSRTAEILDKIGNALLSAAP